jgi:hypothetical protein
MTKKIKSMDDMPVDPVEAVKRSFIHRGLIPRKFRRNSPIQDGQVVTPPAVKKELEKNQNNKSSAKKGGNDSKDSDEAAKKQSESDQVQAQETHEKLIEVTEKAQDILFTADTVFPFTLFPDTISLDREKLTVVQRFFFRVAKVITVPVTSMISADANIGPFFGSVHMTSKYFVDNTHTVNFLWRHDAEKVHRLIQGFIIAHEKGIDVDDIEKEDLRILLEDLGHGTNE